MAKISRRIVRRQIDKLNKTNEEIAETMMKEILNAPLKLRIKFAIGVIFKRAML